MTVTLADRLGDRGAHDGALYNGDAEQRVLGAILCDKKNFHRVTELLGPEHFGNAVHSRIFNAAAHLIAIGKTANPVTLKDLFDQDDALTTIGGARYLAQLAAAGALVDVARLCRSAGMTGPRSRRPFSQAVVAAVRQAHPHDLTE